MSGLRDNGKRLFRLWLIGSQLACTPLAAIVLCGGIGYWMDKKTGRAPLFTVSGLLLGVVAGVYEMFRLLAAVERLNERRKGKER